MNEQAKQPVREFQSGAIRATIWKNEVQQNGRTVVRYSAPIRRVYKDKDGNWRETHNFFAEDMPRVRLLADKVFEFVSLRESEDAQESAAGS